MDLHTLNYFIAVAQEQSLIRAAEKMFVTPSTISQCISKEEQALGLRLFVRSREQWTLTEAGELYIDGCKKILDISKGVNRSIQDIIDDSRGSFTVGVTPGRGPELFAAIYPIFRKEYPNVRIHIIEANSKRLQRLLTDGTIDMFFASHHNPEKSVPSPYIYEALAPEKLVLFVHKDHPVAVAYENLAPSTPVTLDISLFKDDHFIGYNKETAMYNTLNDLFSAANFTPKILFESSSAVIIHKLVVSGIGLAVLPAIYATESDNSRYFHITPTVELQNIVVYNSQTFISKAMRYFIDLAKEFFEDTNKHADF